MFTNQDLAKLLIPLMLEQLLTTLMGTVDTMMVSTVGSAAISAVSLVDSINILLIQLFGALAGGGAIICAQYIGKKDMEKAKHAANQLVFIVTILSVIITAFAVLFNKPLLRLIFGQVEDAVMDASVIYFFITALSYPAIAMYNAGASVYRSNNNSRLPMTISIISNVMNIAGNAYLIYVMKWGVAGAALATLGSRVFCAVVIMFMLKRPKEVIGIGKIHKIKADWEELKRILKVGVPTGIENGMFQFGKLAIQSTVSTLGTVAIAAQAMTNILEALNGVAALAVGLGMMTVVGQCIGAKEEGQAIYYIKKLCVIGEVALVIGCGAVCILVEPITVLAGMEPESAALCIYMIRAITIVKPLFWTLSFVLPYGFRAAGDVKFPMTVSCISMWCCRVALCILLCRGVGLGTMSVWYAMFTDWAVRCVIFVIRFKNRKWMKKSLVC
ncbi:MAG: MATE family efflux transporter [Lachnospiraceae bacterium]|nr:MATE family efflux transporter [Lachnospiraceae bacterium]